MKMRRFTSICVVFGLITILLAHCVHAGDSVVDQSGSRLQAPFGQPRNRSVAKASSAAHSDDVFSTFDLTQDDPGTIHLAGLDIYEESKKLSVKLRHLSNEELRVTSVQVQLFHGYMRNEIILK